MLIKLGFYLISVFISSIVCSSPFKIDGINLKKFPITTTTTMEPLITDLVINMSENSIEEKNPFEVIYQWRHLDFEYPTYESRQRALMSRNFIPENNVPLGIDVLGNRIFVTTPRWKDGIPVSLSWLPYPNKEISPALLPYPDWEEHGDPFNPDCTKLMSVYRTAIDECSRLWVIDSGVVNATVRINQVCPPKIVVYNLKTNRRLFSYEFPSDQVKEDSLHSNIVVDVRDGKCNDAYAYVTDVWRYGIVVFSLRQGRSWRATSHLFYPSPPASDFNIYGLNFQWVDGAFGMSLAPVNEHNDRVLFYHPMASYKEFAILTSSLQSEELWANGFGPAQAIAVIGDRGLRGQSSTSGIDRNGVMFYTLVQQDAIGCWDTRKPYTRSNLGYVTRNSSTITFPNDIKVDREADDQGVWIVTNKLPIYLYSNLDFSDINFRIQRASVSNAVAGDVCDPAIQASASVVPDLDECY